MFPQIPETNVPPYSVPKYIPPKGRLWRPALWQADGPWKKQNAQAALCIEGVIASSRAGFPEILCVSKRIVQKLSGWVAQSKKIVCFVRGGAARKEKIYVVDFATPPENF